MTLSCHFTGCVVQLTSNNAWVSGFKAIRQAVGKPVTQEMLANHTVCRRHSAVLREQGIKVFSYAGTVEKLHRRAEERANAAGFFKLYLPMKEALKRASGNGKSNKKSRQPAVAPSSKKENVTPSTPVMADST